MKQIKIKNEHNENLIGVLHEANNKKEIVIICHGFPGDKDEGFIKKFCENLQEADINAFRFDFSGFGESQGKIMSTTKRISDLKKVVGYFNKKDFNVGLIGHSRGGTVSILFSSKNKNIKFVICIAGEANTKKFLQKIFPHQRKQILKGKMFYYGSKRGKQFPVTPATIKDLESYKPLNAVKYITCPILFVHGQEDISINPKASEDLYQKANHPKKIKFYKNVDHNFSNPKDLEKMIKDCIKWIKGLK
ncbi:alpha/beta hydrolase [Candidatus Pacearchaeota archaeon]|nr:alpha/beta hydrolase [Candidatus Pacearchaeota archaeon]